MALDLSQEESTRRGEEMQKCVSDDCMCGLCVRRKGRGGLCSELSHSTNLNLTLLARDGRDNK